MRRLAKPLLAPLAAMLLAFAFAACGDEEQEPTAATTSTTTTSTTGPTEDTEASKLRERFNAQVERGLVGEYGLTAEQADCAIGILNTSVEEAEVKRAVRTGEPSPQLLQAAFDAGEECGGEG